MSGSGYISSPIKHHIGLEKKIGEILGDIDAIEKVQKRATKLVISLKKLHTKNVYYN